MGLRFVAAWTALSVVARAITGAVLSAAAPLLQYSFDLLSVVAIVTMPLAQWVALRSAGFRWGHEWALATMAGAVFWSAIFTFVESPAIGFRFGASSTLIFSIGNATAKVLFQAIVLRRHAAHVAVWVAAGVAVWCTERASQWLLTGAWFAGPSIPAVSRIVGLSITAATALIEGLVLAWIVLRVTDRAQSPPFRKPHSAWLWVEWTTIATLAVRVIMGASGPIEAAVHGPGTGAVVGRPLFAAFAGAVIGVTQWLLLRRWLDVPPTWIAVSVAALAVPSLGILMPVLGAIVFYGWLMALQIPGGMTLVGAWFGACQWFVLRRYARRAFWWIPATSLAWSMFHLSQYPSSLSFQVIGVAAGAISGLALIPLVKRTANEPAARAEGTSA